MWRTGTIVVHSEVSIHHEDVFKIGDTIFQSVGKVIEIIPDKFRKGENILVIENRWNGKKCFYSGYYGDTESLEDYYELASYKKLRE